MLLEKAWQNGAQSATSSILYQANSIRLLNRIYKKYIENRIYT